MNPGKLSLVILATVIIFAAGVVTGSLIVRRTAPVQITQPFWARFEMTRRAIDELDRQGELTPKQRARIDEIIQINQELIGDYWSILEPDVQQVFRKMRESIREELTPEQRKHFEEFARKRLPRPPGDRRGQPGYRDGAQPPGPPPARDGVAPRPPRFEDDPLPPPPGQRPPREQ